MATSRGRSRCTPGSSSTMTMRGCGCSRRGWIRRSGASHGPTLTSPTPAPRTPLLASAGGGVVYLSELAVVVLSGPSGLVRGREGLVEHRPPHSLQPPAVSFGLNLVTSPVQRLSRFPLNFGGGPHDRQAAIMGSS